MMLVLERSKASRDAAERPARSNTRLNRLEPHTSTGLDVGPSLAHFSDESGIVLQSVVEPIIFGLEANQHASGLPMPRDDDVASLG